MSEVPLYAQGLLDNTPQELSYRGTSLIRKHLTLGPYGRNMPRVLGGS